jgi:hypothetical protein
MLSVWTGRKLSARVFELLHACDTDAGKTDDGRTLGGLTVGEALVELRRTARVLDRAIEIAKQGEARTVLKQLVAMKAAVANALTLIVSLKPRA